MSEPRKMRAVIVDDEPLARRGVRQHLARHPDVTVVGEAGDGESAVALIARESPDLVFLDIEMPGISGLEVAACLDPQALPVLVFVTAYDAYAVEAFEVEAFDYLLKPVDPDRFDATLDRVRRRLQAGAPAGVAPELAALLRRLRGRDQAARLVLREAGSVKILPLADIDVVEAAGNYVQLHCGPESHLWRRSLSGVESELPPDVFVRVHRSALVRVAAIRELKTRPRGDFLLVLASGREVPGSRRHQAQVLALLEGSPHLD